MNLLRRIQLLFVKPTLPRNVEERKRSSVRAIVGAASHGNIRLQWRHYYTQKDIDAKYERLAGTRFADA